MVRETKSGEVIGCTSDRSKMAIGLRYPRTTIRSWRADLARPFDSRVVDRNYVMANYEEASPENRS